MGPRPRRPAAAAPAGRALPDGQVHQRVARVEGRRAVQQRHLGRRQRPRGVAARRQVGLHAARVALHHACKGTRCGGGRRAGDEAPPARRSPRQACSQIQSALLRRLQRRPSASCGACGPPQMSLMPAHDTG